MKNYSILRKNYYDTGTYRFFLVQMEDIMGINTGMLIFGLFDGALAYTIVYCLLKARLGGKKLGRILGTIFGTLIFSVYIALFVYMNTPGVHVNPDFRNLIYAAPIVLFVLLTALVLLSQPPKRISGEEDSSADDADENSGEETATEESL